MKLQQEHDRNFQLTKLPSIAQITRPANGLSPTQLVNWTREFADILEHLRCQAEEALSHEHRQYLLHTLDFDLSHFTDDSIAACALDLLREYTALHVRGNDERTSAERALDRLSLYPKHQQDYLQALAHSHWDLYEVVSLTGEAFCLRRLHDDMSFRLEAPEHNQPFFIGHVVALRLLQTPTLTSAPLAMQFDQLRLVELVQALETEFATGHWQPHQWSEFMAYRGSYLILRHGLADLLSFDRREPCGEIPIDDEDFLSSSDRPPSMVLDLPIGFQRDLEASCTALENSLIACGPSAPGPIIGVAPNGKVYRIEDHEDCPVLLLFPDQKTHQLYERYIDGAFDDDVFEGLRFLRLWRMPVNAIPDEDLATLVDHGLDLHPFGVAMASRVEPGLRFHDITLDDLALLREACAQVVMDLARQTDTLEGTPSDHPGRPTLA
jgi:hypothetical protein